MWTKKQNYNKKIFYILFLTVFILFFSSCEDEKIDTPSKIENPELKLKIMKIYKRVIHKSDWVKIKKDQNRIYSDTKFGPNLVNGEVEGYKFYQVDPKSVFYVLGLRSGDIVVQLNGYALNSVEEGMMKSVSVKTFPWAVDILRKDECIRYEIMVYEGEDQDNLNLQPSVTNSGKEEAITNLDSKNSKEKDQSEIESNEDLKNRVTPISPNTGKEYSKEEMYQFSHLRKIMPNNTLIPKYLSKEEMAKNQKLEESIKEISKKIKNSSADEKEAQIYFSHKEQQLKSRIEILEYLLESSKIDGVGSADKGTFENILSKTKQEEIDLKNQKEAYLKKISLIEK